MLANVYIRYSIFAVVCHNSWRAEASVFFRMLVSVAEISSGKISGRFSTSFPSWKLCMYKYKMYADCWLKKIFRIRILYIYFTIKKYRQSYCQIENSQIHFTRKYFSIRYIKILQFFLCNKEFILLIKTSKISHIV